MLYFKKLPIVVLLFFIIAVNSVLGSSGDKPNIVFIVVDDMGWRDASCYGRESWQTPNIDKIASQGCRFTNAYAQPLCSPTRSELFTGKHAARLGITDWLPGFPNPEESNLLQVKPKNTVPLEEITLAEALKEYGYTTGIVGKWHIGNHPSEQGFDVVRLFHKGGRLPRFDENGRFITEMKADEALQFLDSSKEGPFMLYLAFDAVHLPLDAAKDKIAKHQNTVNPIYAAMLEHVDDAVGRVLDKLEELDLNKDTILIFYSDNGAVTRCNFKPMIYTTNFPLRGNKGSLYEGGVRIPLIIRYPEKIEAGSTSDAFVTPADFYPTILEMAALPQKPEQHQDGMSFAGVFKDSGSDRKTIFWHYPHYSRHVMGYPSGAIRSGDWKMIEWFEDGKIELYNLQEDIGEQNNLADHFPDKVGELMKKMSDWRNEVNAQMPGKKN